MIWLGKYLSLALTLPASALAGYILGSLAVRWSGISLLGPVGIVLGIAAGIVQIVRELSRDERRP